MILAVSIAAGIASAAAGLFLVFAAGQALLEYAECKTDRWWSIPAFLSAVLTIFIPGVVGSLLGALAVAFSVYGALS